MTHSWSNLTGLEERNKKHLTGLTFICPKCKREFKFAQLRVAIISAGYDYLCPEDGYWIAVAEEIEDRKFPNLKSEVLRRERLGGQYVPEIFDWGD